MRVYLDSSALIKRGVEERESEALEDELEELVGAGHELVASSFAWLEVTRGLRRRRDADGPDLSTRAAEEALSGVGESPLTAPVVALARRLDPPLLRSLDALHLATAILLDVGRLIAYDARLLAAAAEYGIPTLAPA